MKTSSKKSFQEGENACWGSDSGRTTRGKTGRKRRKPDANGDVMSLFGQVQGKRVL